MRAEELRDLTDEEIRGRLGELEEERFRLRFRSATETLEDPLRLRVIRRDVARMQTVLRERALGKMVPVAAKPEKTAAAASGKGGRVSRARGGRKS